MLPPPQFSLFQAFQEIKTHHKDNITFKAGLNTPESQDLQKQQEVKGLKFISKKLLILLEKNREIQYFNISRILSNNLASTAKQQKNLKRRIYDALNVLEAVGAIIKENNIVEYLGQRGERRKIEKIGERQKKQVQNKREEVQILRKKIEILKKMLKLKRKPKGQLIDNPQLMLGKGNLQTIRLTSSEDHTLITLNGLSITPPQNLSTFLTTF